MNGWTTSPTTTTVRVIFSGERYHRSNRTVRPGPSTGTDENFRRYVSLPEVPSGTFQMHFRVLRSVRVRKYDSKELNAIVPSTFGEISDNNLHKSHYGDITGLDRFPRAIEYGSNKFPETAFPHRKVLCPVYDSESDTAAALIAHTQLSWGLDLTMCVTRYASSIRGKLLHPGLHDRGRGVRPRWATGDLLSPLTEISHSRKSQREKNGRKSSSHQSGGEIEFQLKVSAETHAIILRSGKTNSSITLLFTWRTCRFDSRQRLFE